MGLDTTHGCFHGTYSKFHRFRKALAAQIGISLDEYKQYNDKGFKDLRDLKGDLIPLLNHSDCDGELSVEECKMIERGIANVLANFNDKLGHDDDFGERLAQFREGLLDAIEKGEVVVFC